MRMYNRHRMTGTKRRIVPYVFPESFGGQAHTLITTADDRLLVTGTNTSGQLGLGHKSPVPTFVQVTGIADIKKTAEAAQCSFVLTNSGILYAAGTVADNQWGSPGFSRALVFTQILTGVKDVWAYEGDTWVLKTDNTLWGSGANSYSQLSGNGAKSVFTQMATNVADMAMGVFHSTILKLDGTIWAVGNNSSGQLGTGDTVNKTAWVQVAQGITGAASVYATYQCGFILTSDGQLYGTGNKAYGELGLGHINTLSSYTQLLTEVPGRIVQVAPGRIHVAVLYENGDLYTCGNASAYKLGTGSLTATYLFTKVATDVVQVGCTSNATLITKQDGTVWGVGATEGFGLGAGTSQAFVKALNALT